MYIEHMNNCAVRSTGQHVSGHQTSVPSTLRAHDEVFLVWCVQQTHVVGHEAVPRGHTRPSAPPPRTCARTENSCGAGTTVSSGCSAAVRCAALAK